LLPLEWAYADDIAANVPFRHTGLLVILHDLTYTSDVAFHAVLQDIMPVFLLLAVAMAGLGLLLHVTMTRRVNRLIASVRLFSGGDYQARACVSGQDEIALIGDAFDAMADRITSVQDNLEHQIMERTIQLENSLAALQQTQESVLQTEKMGALGRLVMEIAHEINTPLGIAITTSTLIRDQFDDMAGAFRNNQLKRAHLADYVTVMANTLTILVANLNRTAALVREFKQMTLQQSAAEGYRQFALCPYLREVLHTLTPMLYPHHHRATVNCSENIFMRGFPEILARILTNLVVNSLEHGFADGRRGTITITALRRQDRVILEYRDNGVGLSATARGRIFEPFYTTKKENGHIGLGLTVVYNLVTQVYCGKIQCTGDSTTGLETGLETELETGLGIILDLPLALPIPEGAIVTQYMPP
jgi:signal transduction histidine kinase